MKTSTGFAPLQDRYFFDLTLKVDNGWAQLDTSQDAPYYGNWINPITLELFCYCEGDTTHTKCETVDEFVAALRQNIAWHNENGYGPALIDCHTLPVIRDRLVALGLDDLTH
jgi:hypothetical protein